MTTTESPKLYPNSIGVNLSDGPMDGVSWLCCVWTDVEHPTKEQFDEAFVWQSELLCNLLRPYAEAALADRKITPAQMKPVLGADQTDEEYAKRWPLSLNVFFDQISECTGDDKSDWLSKKLKECGIHDIQQQLKAAVIAEFERRHGL